MTVTSKYTIVDPEAGTSYHLPRLSMETAGLAVPAGGSFEQLFWGVVLRAPTGSPRDFIWLWTVQRLADDLMMVSFSLFSSCHYIRGWILVPCEKP